MVAYRAKKDVIMRSSTPAMRGDCIGAGKSLAIVCESGDPTRWGVCGASKDIFVTGSLSNISRVGNRRMMLLGSVSAIRRLDGKTLTSCRCPRDCSDTLCLVWGFQSESVRAISTTCPSCLTTEISNQGPSIREGYYSRERDWRYSVGSGQSL